MSAPAAARQVAGMVKRQDAEVIIIFRVGNKYYPNTEVNGQIMETYLHTGDGSILDQLENEVQF